MDAKLICVIIVALAAIGILVYWYLNKPTEEQKKIINEFLDSLYDSILEVIKMLLKRKISMEKIQLST